MVYFLYWDSISKVDETREQRYSFEVLINYCRRSLWALFGVIVDQEDYNPIMPSNKILWYTIVASMFFAIFGVYLNLLSCDLVSQHQASQIKTLDEFLTDEKWEGYDASSLQESYFYNYMITSGKGTAVRTLYERKHSNGQPVLTSYLASKMGMSKMLKTVDRMISGYVTRKNKVVMIFERVLWKFFGWKICCGYNPDGGENFYLPAETFSNGLISTYYGKHVPENMARRHVFNMRTYAEGGFVEGMFSLSYVVVDHLMDHINMRIDWKTIKCIDGIADNDSQFSPLRLTSLHSLFRAMSFSLVFSCTVIIIERILSAFMKATKSRRQKLFKRNSDFCRLAIVK